MIDQSAVLQIPYFEFLRLRAWIQMAFPKVLLGIGILRPGFSHRQQIQAPQNC